MPFTPGCVKFCTQQYCISGTLLWTAKKVDRRTRKTHFNAQKQSQCQLKLKEVLNRQPLPCRMVIPSHDYTSQLVQLPIPDISQQRLTLDFYYEPDGQLERDKEGLVVVEVVQCQQNPCQHLPGCHLLLHEPSHNRTQHLVSMWPAYLVATR